VDLLRTISTAALAAHTITSSSSADCRRRCELLHGCLLLALPHLSAAAGLLALFGWALLIIPSCC
jgi:hypothetical protein